MAERLFMTALSPTMTEGAIARWRAGEGEPFKAGEVLCEVETDKASMDLEAPKAGVLLKILVPQGGRAAVGDPIAIYGKAGEDPSALLAELAAARGAGGGGAPAPEATPPAGSSPPRAPAEAAPPLAPRPPAPPQAAAAPPGAARSEGGPRAPAGYPPSSPLARKLARERGLDIRLLPGTGPGGRVVSRDVEGFRPGLAGPAPSAGLPAPEAHGAGRREDRRIPVQGKRAVIARRLSESFFGAPHYYLKKKVRADRLLEARAAINQGRETPISLNAFFVKLAAEALRRHPALNSSWEGDAILERGSVDIGLAVALPDGLITPVVRDAGSKGIERIEAELAALIEKARTRGLAPAEYEGASFTITNLGSFGIDEFTAIINPPGSAILALGAARREAEVLEDGSLAPRRVMRLTLGCDHRAVDGAVGAAFLRDLAAAIEEPLRALL